MLGPLKNIFWFAQHAFLITLYFIHTLTKFLTWSYLMTRDNEQILKRFHQPEFWSLKLYKEDSRIVEII